MYHEILLVDDDVIILDAIEANLEGDQYRFHKAVSSSDALDILNQYRIDLVLVDYRMPDMSGLELLEIIMKRYPDITRLMFTGNPDQALLSTLAQYKFLIHGYIVKPCEMEVLKNTLNLYLLRSELMNS